MYTSRRIPGYLLGLVAQVRVIADGTVLGEFYHSIEGVLRIGIRVVRVDTDHGDSLVIGGDTVEHVDLRFGVRTVIAGKHDQQRVVLAEVRERVRPVVGSR